MLTKSPYDEALHELCIGLYILHHSLEIYIYHYTMMLLYYKTTKKIPFDVHHNHSTNIYIQIQNIAYNSTDHLLLRGTA